MEDTQLIHVRLPKALLERLDTFRFANRKTSRTEALIQVLDGALAAESTHRQSRERETRGKKME